MPIKYATSALINAYTIRRINGNSLTSDYFLAVGEEAIYTWDTTASLSKPLYIATTQGIYLMVIQGPYQTSKDILLYLNPNNTTYTNAFTLSLVGYSDGSTTPGGGVETYSAFSLRGAASGITIAYISTYTTGKFLVLTQRITRKTNGGAVHLLGLRWNDTTTAWTSLGTLTTTAANGTINVLVRRLV